MVERVLDGTSVDPAALMLEITESLFLDDSSSSAVDDLVALRTRGARISLDDFGTGYSSLSYLKRLPVDILKIDRSFIRDCNDNAEDRTLVRAILAMARALNIEVIGEGAEVASHLQLLRDGGCNYVQGFLFSRPLPAEEFAAFARQPKLRPFAEA
jgi:EAL domain-containing protein (putative c-di-GMP-specific phosphodiesterase class I)